MMQLAMWVKFGMNMKLIHIDEIPNLSNPKLYWGSYIKHLFCANIARYILLKGRGELVSKLPKLQYLFPLSMLLLKL